MNDKELDDLKIIADEWLENNLGSHYMKMDMDSSIEMTDSLIKCFQSLLKQAELRAKRDEILDILKFVGFDSSTDSQLDLSGRLEDLKSQMEKEK